MISGSSPSTVMPLLLDDGAAKDVRSKTQLGRAVDSGGVAPGTEVGIEVPRTTPVDEVCGISSSDLSAKQQRVFAILFIVASVLPATHGARRRTLSTFTNN
jgi:hypothetical protein